jgi:hypothetical protein
MVEQRLPLWLNGTARQTGSCTGSMGTGAPIMPRKGGFSCRPEEFLSSGGYLDQSYRKNVAGVLVPSRFYNLLAIDRTMILISNPGRRSALVWWKTGSVGS